MDRTNGFMTWFKFWQQKYKILNSYAKARFVATVMHIVVKRTIDLLTAAANEIDKAWKDVAFNNALFR